MRLEAADLPWHPVAAAWLPEGDALVVRERLRGQFGRFGLAICVPFGREPQGRVGVLVRAAAAAPDLAALDEIEDALQQLQSRLRCGIECGSCVPR